MALRRDLIPNLANLSVRSYPVGHAHDSKERFPEECLHPSRAIILDDTKIRIRKQRKIQFVLDLEFCLRVHGIAAASDNRSVRCIELLDGVTKLGRFAGSTGSIRLGVEEQHYILPLVVRKRNGFSVVCGCAKPRRFVALFQHSFSLLTLRIARITIPTARASESHLQVAD